MGRWLHSVVYILHKITSQHVSYADLWHHLAHDKCFKQIQNLGGDGTGITGTINENGVRAIMKKALILMHNMGIYDYIFVDVGAHNGRMLVASLCYEAQRAIGIEMAEVMDGRMRLFQRMRSLYMHYSSRQACPAFLIGGTNVVDLHAKGEPFPCCSSDLHKFVYVFDDGFNEESRRAVYSMAARDAAVAVLVTYPARASGALFGGKRMKDEVLSMLNSDNNIMFEHAGSLTVTLLQSKENKKAHFFVRAHNVPFSKEVDAPNHRQGAERHSAPPIGHKLNSESQSSSP